MGNNVGMRKYIYCVAIAAVSMLGSCSRDRNGDGQGVTRSQIEEAHNAGREAARDFVRKEWKDTFELQQQLMEAASKAARYDSVTRLRAAYDSAFISTIKTVRPEVAAELESYRRQIGK